jgi:hypothetical protein
VRISPEESAAKSIIESVLPDRLLEQLDDGHSNQVADFKVLDRNTRHQVGVLEVTSANPPARRSFDASLAKLDWAFPDLTRSWRVNVKSVDRDDVPLKDLHRELPALLNRVEFESPSPDTIEVDPWDPRTPEWHRELDHLGVTAITPIPFLSSPNRIEIRKPSVGGFLGWSLINKEVHREANKADNLAKLRVGKPGAIAELFVWLTDTTGQITLDFAGNDLLHEGRTAEVPSLPDGITGVWVASGMGDLSRLARALFFTAGNGWMPYLPPERDDPNRPG